MRVYDSVYLSARYDTQEAICILLRYGQPPPKNDKIVLLVMDANCQGVDEEDTCSLHSIPNDLSLAFGMDPTTTANDEGTMREHLSFRYGAPPKLR